MEQGDIFSVGSFRVTRFIIYLHGNLLYNRNRSTSALYSYFCQPYLLKRCNVYPLAIASYTKGYHILFVRYIMSLVIIHTHHLLIWDVIVNHVLCYSRRYRRKSVTVSPSQGHRGRSFLKRQRKFDFYSLELTSGPIPLVILAHVCKCEGRNMECIVKGWQKD